MALVLMCSASDTRHSPKAYAKRWSRSFRASSSKKTSPRHFLPVLRPRLSQQRERAMRIYAPISSATTSGAIFTSRSRIHLFRIRRSVKSCLRVDQRRGNPMTSRDSPLMKGPIPHFRRWYMANPCVLIKRIGVLLVVAGLFVFLKLAYGQQEQRGQTSYMKVDSTESFAAMMARMTAAKPGIEREHN